MSGRDQINIVTSGDILEIEHMPGQSGAIYLIGLLRRVVLADLIVLTVVTVHITIAEKDGARPPVAG